MPVPMKGGKSYATVQERLTAAHGETARPEGITSIVTVLQSLPSSSGPVVFAIATITFTDGRIFTGISEAQFDATSGADKTNPIEVADTSAVGRALAMAGYYGSDEGLAGAEEVRDAQRRQNLPPRSAPRQAPPNAAPPGAWPRQQAAAPTDDVNTIPAGIVADTNRMQGKPAATATPAAKQTPRQWYAAAAPEARKKGIKAPDLTDDAPDDYVLTTCQWLKDELRMLREHEARTA